MVLIGEKYQRILRKRPVLRITIVHSLRALFFSQLLLLLLLLLVLLLLLLVLTVSDITNTSTTCAPKKTVARGNLMIHVDYLLSK